MSRQSIPRALWAEIREAYREGEMSCRQLAEEFGVTAEAVSTRCKREGWRDPAPDDASTVAQIAPPDALQGGDSVPLPLELVAVDRNDTYPINRAAAFEGRVQRESEAMLDEIQRVLRDNKSYDRVELLRWIVPQWKAAVDQGRKAYGLDRDAPPVPMINVALISNGTLPPLKHRPDDGSMVGQQPADDASVIAVEPWLLPGQREAALAA